MFTNVHVTAPPVTQPSTIDSQLPRLRFLTNDPAREYAARPGEVEKLPDSVAALILCKQGFNKVGRNGITIQLDGKSLNYWSEHSITIQTKAGTNEKVLWTVNRHQPDVLHVLSQDGEYIESIPLDGKVPWFDADATQRELGAKRRAQGRTMERVRNLHAADTQAELDRTDANSAAIAGLVQTFPQGRSRSNEPQRIDPNQPVAVARGGLRDPLSSNARHPAAEDNGAISPAPVKRAQSLAVVRPLDGDEANTGHSSARGTFFSAADRIHQVQRDVQDGRVTRESAAAFGAVTRRSANDLSGEETSTASPGGTPDDIEIW